MFIKLNTKYKHTYIHNEMLLEVYNKRKCLITLKQTVLWHSDTLIASYTYLPYPNY